MRYPFPFPACHAGLCVVASLGLASTAAYLASVAAAEQSIAEMQTDAIVQGNATWGHWGADPALYSGWTSHSNRLIPIYTFGITLDSIRQAPSPFTDEARLRALYGYVPEQTLQPERPPYFDQTDVYRLQQEAVRLGKKHIVLMVFDGMDWHTTRAAAIYKTGRVAYDSGRGCGLAFQADRAPENDFGFFVTSPASASAEFDVDAQVVMLGQKGALGGYSPTHGGLTPWDSPAPDEYLLGELRQLDHAVTDSASSATSICAGIKTYNAAINVASDGQQVEPIARQLQAEGWSVGVVTSVPISHATPAAAYANNVTRNDYQDLTRDLLGLPSRAHRGEPLPGVDVLLGGGFGETAEKAEKQGVNFVPGNVYLTDADLERVDADSSAAGPGGEGRYVAVTRTAGRDGKDILGEAVERAVAEQKRLLGFFGAPGGNLPYQTADGDFEPVIDAKKDIDYSPADIRENPTLADMTEAALQKLESNERPFWLLVEAGDVDWANHANNIDSSIGAVLSGEAAFERIVQWVDDRDAWDSTAVIVTADHGHFLVLDDPEKIAAAARIDRRERKTDSR